MEKVKSFFKKTIESIKNGIKEFPLTMIIAAFCTILISFNIIFEAWDEEGILKFIYAAVIFAIGTFFTEITKKEDKKSKMIMYILSFLIAIGFWAFAYAEDEVVLANALKIAISYCAILGTISVFILQKTSKLDFGEYIRELIISGTKVGITSTVLTIGSVFIYAVLSELFDLDYDVTEKIMLVLITCIYGLYALPRMIGLLKVEKKTDNKFFEGLFKYALGGIILVITAIIYAYILKIIFTLDVPSNVIYRITAVLFFFAAVTRTVVNSYEAKDFYGKIFKYLPYLFLPFIILQIYSLGARIVENGLTPVRYIGVMYIIFECIYLGLYKFKKEKLSNILLVFGVITCITLSVPFINMDKLSELNQISRAKTFFKVDDPENDLTDKQKAKVQGAYYYIEHNLDDGYSKIDELFTYEEQEIIENFEYKHQGNQPEREMEYMYRNNSIDVVNIENYSKLYEIDYYLSSNKENKLEDDYIYDLTEEKEINLKPVIDKIIENDVDDEKEYIYEYDIDENYHLIITYVSIEYARDGYIEYCSLNGYILEK